jgi:hypothetical protein
MASLVALMALNMRFSRRIAFSPPTRRFALEILERIGDVGRRAREQ